MDVTGIARNLMKGRLWSLRSYARVPSVTGSGRTLTVTTSPVLIFQYDMRTDYGVPRPNDTGFKINQRNIAKVSRFFETAVSWLDPKKFTDLYIQDEKEGRLMINMDYQGLQVVVKGSRYDAQAMVAFPLVFVEDGKEEPGVGIAINKQEYTFAIKEDDIAAISHFLRHFSFQEEALIMTQLATNPLFWEPQTGMADPRFIPSSSPSPNTYDGSNKLTW